MARTKQAKRLAKSKEEEEESVEEEIEEKPIKKKKTPPKKQKEETKVLSRKRGRSKKKNEKENSEDEEEEAVDINDDPKISESDSEGEKEKEKGQKKSPPKKTDKTKKKTKTPTKKALNHNFINKEDVNVTKVITVKKIKNTLYAYVMYTEKGKNKSPVNKGLIPTSEFIDSEPERLLSFYESKIEFTPDRLSEEEEEDEK